MQQGAVRSLINAMGCIVIGVEPSGALAHSGHKKESRLIGPRAE
jgi:hypothetical protein